MYYMETHSTDPSYNLAFEEYVLHYRTEGDYLLLWQNDRAVIIGQNQNTAEEINASFIEAMGIRVVRRSTGGGAVYHDLGNLNYSFITDYNQNADPAIRRFSSAVVRALGSLGLHAEASGRNDILIDGKKISGTAQRILGHRILYHGTLLFDVSPEMISGALHADPSKFSSKSTKSVRSRVGNIKESLRGGPYQEITLDEFWKLIREKLAAEGKDADESPLTECMLSDAELSAVSELQKRKYQTWEWNYGRSPVFSYHNKKRFAGGTLEVWLDIKKGRIEDAALYGDFLSLCALDDLIEKLAGQIYDRETIDRLLAGTNLRIYLGNITKNELLDVMFP